MKGLTRPDSDEYFLKIAAVVAERSTCRRHHIGAIAVKDKHILATGCRGIHAEQNVIIQAGLHGVSLKGSTIYCTHTPCILCAKMLVNARIKRYVSFGRYNDIGFRELFREAGIEVDVKKRPTLRISYLD